VDPVGACVGHRGSRVQAVVTELFGEKIDIVRWSASVPDYITAALQPAKVMSVKVDEEAKSAFVIVPDNQLSLAIGKEGQNVRLAARLTGWRIDIRSETQVRERLQHEMEAAQAELAAASGAESQNNHTGEPHALEAEGLPAEGAEPRVEEPTDVEVMR
jgi:transcription antitermination factor NusA-like protein